MRLDLRRKRRRGSRGFTLLDMMTAMVVGSVLTVTALPHYVDLSNEAAVTNEAQAIAALRSAIEAQRGQNMIAGVANSKGGFLPEGNPFDLLEVSPANQEVPYANPNTQDGKTWRVLRQSGGDPLPMWLIVCPHYNGWANQLDINGATQGEAWIYCWNKDNREGAPEGLYPYGGNLPGHG